MFTVQAYSSNLKCLLILISIFFNSAQFCLAQIQIDTSRSADAIVKEVLLGSGVWAGNISYTGAPHAIAVFETDSVILPIKKGLLLTTGNVYMSKGPNKYTDMSWASKSPGYNLLETIANGPTHDAALLEFDFVTASENLSFNFVFASEEYTEYVGSKYNDVFAFFINGPSLENVNLATLPKSSTPITINSVNNKRNRKYYIDNPTESINFPILYDVRKKKVVKNKYFNKKKALPQYNIQFDGFTTTLQAACKVVPGEIYHIQIAIADVADLILDSGVYLEANSFISTGKMVIPIQNPFIPASAPQTSIKIKETPIVVEKPVVENLSCFTVNFNFDCYSLTDSALTVLKEAYQLIQFYPASSIEIIGHTDNIGSDTYNDALSRNRSNTVAHFISTLGIDQSRLSIKAKGEREPVESNETAVGRFQNRRTEVIVKWTQ